MSTSEDGIHWSPVQLIPIDPQGSGIDYIVPGLRVDKHTSDKTAHLALTYDYHTTNCDSHCQYYAGFISSTIDLLSPFFSIASAPKGGYLKEAMYTISGGLIV